jgi:hypothetical protein
MSGDMKKQKVIAKTDVAAFEISCQKLLDDGWLVIPGTISTNCSMVEGGADHYTRVEKILVAFFEEGYKL